MLSDKEIHYAIKAWQSNNEGLPTPVRAAYDAWDAFTIPQLKAQVLALRPNSKVKVFPPIDNASLKHCLCVTLTAHGQAPPGTPSHPPADLRYVIYSLIDNMAWKMHELEPQVQRADYTESHLIQQRMIKTIGDVSAIGDIYDEVAKVLPAQYVVELPKEEL